VSREYERSFACRGSVVPRALPAGGAWNRLRSTVLCKTFPKCFVLMLSCYSLPLGSIYSPQHPVLKHPQIMFFPYSGRQKQVKL
jgi:hypothetical protein